MTVRALHPSRKSRGYFLHAAALLLLVPAGNADDWPLPQVSDIYSESREYYVRVIPGDSWGDARGFEGSPKGKYATAEFYCRAADGSYAPMAQTTLVNPMAPVEIFVSDDGYLVTLDNWHNVGYGKVVAIYGPDGRLIRAYELSDLLPAEHIKTLRRSVSSIYWHHRATYIKPDRKMLSVALDDGRELLFDLPTGAHRLREFGEDSYLDRGILTLIGQLGSAQQDIRDGAAAKLRPTWQAPDRRRWEPLLASLKPDMKKRAVFAQMRERGAAALSWGSMGSGQSHTETYRLDDVWMLRASFKNSARNHGMEDLEATLYRWELDEHMRHVWVNPPSGFTGTWITYFVNGRKANEIPYRDGNYFGEFISYRADGSKSTTQRYSSQGADGTGMGYFPSGAIKYRIFYKDGKPTGTWTWYNEDGSVQNTEEAGMR